MRKLTIVVTCTNRKSLPPATGLRLRDLGPGCLAERSDSWLGRLHQATGGRSLVTLYQGEAWAQMSGLARAATSAGYQPRLLVVSAGLGLREIESVAPSYAATFASRHNDSVGQSTGDAQEWWARLAKAPQALDPSRELRGRVLLVLSAVYASALQTDLSHLATVGAESLMIGGGADMTGIMRIPADRGLRPVLGGTATSLNVRVAKRWLEQLDGRDLTSRHARDRWMKWAASVRREERWDRQSLTDVEVLRFITQLLRNTPGVSRTSALRRLRDSGRACEQRRFADLFQATQDAA